MKFRVGAYVVAAAAVETAWLLCSLGGATSSAEAFVVGGGGGRSFVGAETRLLRPRRAVAVSSRLNDSANPPDGGGNNCAAPQTTTTTTTTTSERSPPPSLIPYSCPPPPEASLNDKPGDFDLYLDDCTANEKLSLDELRKMPYDAMAPFDVGKARMRPWILEAFVPYLQPGDSIYESACGQGLNLLLTAEVLREAGISPITVYGNDYLESSVNIARRVWDAAEDEGVARKGRFCVGDSADLSHVPPDSFDLVFTGYVAPLFDPLNLIPGSTGIQEKVLNSYRLCGSSDPGEVRLCKLEQSRQEVWFARWVTEMIRIAKPGKVVCAEMNAESLCRSGGDFGGVDKEWWYGAVEEYGWDVDPDSVLIRDVVSMPGWPGDRYHVMMRKRS